MTTVSTDMRATQETARRIRFEPSSLILATDVQTAIQVAGGTAGTAVNSGMSPFTPADTDTILLVDTTAGPVTINLPLAASRHGVRLLVKDVAGNARVNNITINPTAPETIEGLPNLPIVANYGAFQLYPATAKYVIVP